MASRKKKSSDAELVHEWPLPAAATLGSSVRAKGIMLEIRAHLPMAARKALDVRAGVLVLGMQRDENALFEKVSATVAKHYETVESLVVLPREVEDILAISTTERHRWLSDGRLPSAGTRTIKRRGRARKITFHVFDPRMVEELLDSDRVAEFREEDAITKAENRRKAAWKAKLKRAGKSSTASEQASSEPNRPNLVGWEEFEREGLLR